MQNYSQIFTIYIVYLAAILGACMGSFLCCYAWRIVHGESVIKGRSHCDYCGHVLGALDLIPIASYLVHRGKCKYCGKKLSPKMLFGEIISALIFAVTVYSFGISLKCIECLLFASILLAISFADLEDYLVPDRFIIAGIVIRFVFILSAGNIKTELISALIGGFAVAFALLLVVIVFEKITGKDAMGGGDIKLIFVTGLYLGWQKNILCLVLACIIGIVFGLAFQKRNDELSENSKAFPFGPSIALGAWICYLFGDNIIGFYLSFF